MTCKTNARIYDKFCGNFLIFLIKNNYLKFIALVDNRLSFGIMQGRLSQKIDLPLQSFPHDSWENEFSRAKELGFKRLEWLVDIENDYNNPIFSEN